MRKSISVLIVLGVLLISLLSNPSSSSAAVWGKGHSDAIQYAFVGAGWGSVTYNVYTTEDWAWNLTYKRAISTKRQVDVSYKKACPYTCELRFSNNYYNSGDGSHITGQSSTTMSSGSYWAKYSDGNATNYSKISSADISSDINYYLNLKTTMSMWVYKSGWVHGGSKAHWSYIR
ncbi:hypothetical protein ACSFXN_18360 [Planococcus sp. 1R117A]|uniref:hypothetical protein n=1 Tax=Planococcus sp. 1R117A TaxID=3447020 RepID=UPI003EDB6F7A